MNIDPNSSSVNRSSPSNGALQPVSFANGTIRSGFNSENISWLLDETKLDGVHVNTRRTGKDDNNKAIEIGPNSDLSSVGLREGLAVIDHYGRDLQCAKALLDREYDLDASRIFANIVRGEDGIALESQDIGDGRSLEKVKYKNLEMYIIKCGDGCELCVDYIGNEGTDKADEELENFLEIYFQHARERGNLELRVGNRKVGIPIKNAFSKGRRFLSEDDRVLLGKDSMQFLKSSQALLSVDSDIGNRYGAFDQLTEKGEEQEISVATSVRRKTLANNASFSSEEVGGIIDNMQKYKQRLVQQEITKKAIEYNKADFRVVAGSDAKESIFPRCLNRLKATLDVVYDAEEFEQKQLEAKVNQGPDYINQTEIVNSINSLRNILDSGIESYRLCADNREIAELMEGFGTQNLFKDDFGYRDFLILKVVQDLKVNFNLSDVDLSKFPYADILMENLTDIEAVLLSDLDGKKFGIPEVKLAENFEYSDEKYGNWKDSFARKSLLENNRNKDAGETLLNKANEIYPGKLGEIRHDASQHLHSWIKAFEKCIIYGGGIESAEDANKKIEDSDGKETAESFEKRAEAGKWLNFAKSLEGVNFDKISDDEAGAEDQKISAKDIVADIILTKVLDADDIKRTVQRMYNTWESGNVGAILKRYQDNPNTDTAVEFHYGLDSIGARSQLEVESALAILFTQVAIDRNLLELEDGEKFYNELCKAFISNRVSSVPENNDDGGAQETVTADQKEEPVQDEVKSEQKEPKDVELSVDPESKRELGDEINAAPVFVNYSGEYEPVDPNKRDENRKTAYVNGKLVYVGGFKFSVQSPQSGIGVDDLSKATKVETVEGGIQVDGVKYIPADDLFHQMNRLCGFFGQFEKDFGAILRSKLQDLIGILGEDENSDAWATFIDEFSKKDKGLVRDKCKGFAVLDDKYYLKESLKGDIEEKRRKAAQDCLNEKIISEKGNFANDQESFGLNFKWIGEEDLLSWGAKKPDFLVEAS